MRTEAEVQVISLYDRCGSRLEETLERRHIPVWHVGKHRGIDLSVISRLVRLVGRLRPDVIHTHMHTLYYVLPAAKIAAVPVFVHTIHNVADRDANRLGRILGGMAFRAGVVPVAIAEAVRRTVEKTYRLRNVPVILNGICVSDFDWTENERADCRGENNISEDTLLFVTLARVCHQKGIDILLEAFRNLTGRCKASALWIAGDGPLRTQLAQAARGLSNVRFLGARSDVRRLLAAADVFVLPSRYEGNPMALMEAMAARKPVIATAVGGVPELLRENQHGLLVQPESPEKLAEAMISLASDRDARVRMGESAGEWARCHFTSSNMATAYMKLYRHLLGTKGVVAYAGL
jgi:glycosyltransferase involved in cell wall biosynthesis